MSFDAFDCESILPTPDIMSRSVSKEEKKFLKDVSEEEFNSDLRFEWLGLFRCVD